MINNIIFFGRLRGLILKLTDHVPENIQEWLLEKLYPSDATVGFL